MDESEIIPINDYDSDLESETDSETSINDSRSIDSFSDDFDFDISDDDLIQARNFYEIDCNNPSAPPPRFAFTTTPEIHLEFDASSGKMQYYEALIDNSLIDLIVHETNRYAEQTIGSRIPRRHSRSKKWEPTSKEEMHVFIALIILQGIVKKPTNEQYWSKRHSISTPFFSKVMSYRRFNLIYRFLHFSDNETFVTETHECPKLSKIWPVLKYLTIRFKEVVTPDRDVTIDESLMLFKGRLGWKQYMPLKRSRFGIKSYMLCESKSGMDIVDCLIERYGKVSGKKGRLALQPNPMILTERHFLEVIAPSEKKLRPEKKCYVCSLKKNDTKKETRYFCPDCDVGLCLTPCFKLYHTKLDL
ncbi:piggyBac transposable element-derived protein 4 [Trichonephila clavipes]|nr:piggyBac transposable element-derived protein 4 [Trichonephila clavipes]